MSILSKEKRTVYKRKIQNFWEDFGHNKIGIVGLAIILLYVAVAIFTPYLTPYRPRTLMYTPPTLADSFAMPEWMRIFPQFRELPPTLIISTFQNVTLAEESGPVAFNQTEDTIEFISSTRTNATILLNLFTINYTYSTAPSYWRIDFTDTEQFVRETGYTLQLILTTEGEKENWKTYLQDPTKAIIYQVTYASPPVIKGNATVSTNRTRTCLTISGFQDVVTRLFQWKYQNDTQKLYSLSPSKLLMTPGGVYHVKLQITFDSTRKITKQDSICRIQLNNGTFFTPGQAWGILGTDYLGNDVWTDLVYGVRISLLVGILAAVISTALGISLGAIAGFFEGPLDQAIMRIVDILLCLPVLPLLLILIRYFAPSVYFVIVLIAIFGWQGLSRLVRSRVLSIKEAPFIESAKAAGASNSYIITRHIIPNVIPVAMASMILAVPGAILTEAALSFLGFSDPNVATWGRMLEEANTQGAFTQLAWWYIIPPGIAITILCLGFVFISHALDEIVNPRLRRRR
jgi:ABC-type dipeptide/oligopeptide/nickel transport system permease subunit